MKTTFNLALRDLLRNPRRSFFRRSPSLAVWR